MSVEDSDAAFGQSQPDDPVVGLVAGARDQPGALAPVDEFDGRVVADQEVLGDLTDRRVVRARMPADREQELVLARGDALCLGLFRAPTFEHDINLRTATSRTSAITATPRLLLTLLPLIIGASTAFAVSVLVLKRSVLTEKIARRGFHLSREYDVDPLEILFIGEVMDDDILTFEAHVPATEALEAISDTAPDNVAARRQMLYPIVGDADRLLGVVTRTQLETAVHRGDGEVAVTAPGIAKPCVTHPDETLRSVAAAMAANAVDRMPVVDRHDPTRIVGMISLTMLLAGRLRDLQEARDAERVLRLRVVRPRWLPPRAAV
ncbi:MAG TPA: CBS domain-containing protein [Jatrophihabitantaceae bacterium]